MLLALEKAFAAPDPELQAMRRRSYSRLHSILAGCYFQARMPRRFLINAVKSLRYHPSGAAYLVAYPLRVMARQKWLWPEDSNFRPPD